MLEREFTGFTLRAMEAASARSCNDLVAHTIGHFLRTGEDWGRLSPQDALGPEEVRQSLEEAGIDVDRFARNRERRETGRLPARCWLPGAIRELLVATHANGYWPRYAGLVEQAGDPDGETWQVADQRRRATVAGYRLVVQAIPNHPTSWRSITAFRRGVFLDSVPSRGRPNSAMAAALERLHCQEPGFAASLRPGPDSDLLAGSSTDGEPT